MPEHRKQAIESCGRECVRCLILADIYDKAGDYASAVSCYEVAEAEAELAFVLARAP